MTRDRPPLAPGDVVLGEVIFTDYSDIKTRPVVVLSTKEYDAGSDDVVIVGMTSRIDAPSQYKCVIDSSDSDFESTGLKRDTAVLCSKVLTIHFDKLTRRLGRLPEARLATVRSLVRQALSL